ncbi:MAG: sensor histidine kinase [Anaerolineae bacterium]|nr:sensor histidine kinase [Anaerolineae bacterium]
MTLFAWLNSLIALSHQLKWRLTLTYLLVSLAAIFVAAWWAIIAVALYLGQVYADLNWQEAIQDMAPALWAILPSSLLLVFPAALVSAYFGFLSARWLDGRFAQLRQATAVWRQGDFTTMIQDESADEIGDFGDELNEMAAELRGLLQSRQELAALEERQRLARDLHDSVKQHLAAAALQIGAAEALLPQNTAAAQASLTQAGELTHQAQRELGAIIFALQPTTLGRQGLAAALRDYAASWSRQFGIAAAIDSAGERPLPPEVEGALFRFAQEALTNVARHSGADSVRINFRCQANELQLTIHDNGRGFDPQAAPTSGFGLQNMRQRLAELGGQTIFDAAPGKGTTVTAYLPL